MFDCRLPFVPDERKNSFPCSETANVENGGKIKVTWVFLPFAFNANMMLRVGSFGMILIRISDPRSLTRVMVHQRNR